jgi:hypothetical protein
MRFNLSFRFSAAADAAASGFMVADAHPIYEKGNVPWLLSKKKFRSH